MPDSTKVVRFGYDEFLQHEAMADGSEIDVGALLQRSANGVQPHGTDGGVPTQTLIAVDARGRGMELGDAYPAGDNVKYVAASGGGFHLPIAAGVTVAENDRLVSAGDGTVRTIDQDGTSPDDPDAAAVAVADEDVDNSGGSDIGYVAVEVLN